MTTSDSTSGLAEYFHIMNVFHDEFLGELSPHLPSLRGHGLTTHPSLLGLRRRGQELAEKQPGGGVAKVSPGELPSD